jgi:hypothetical protein
MGSVRIKKELGGCGESETPGSSQSSIFQVEQVSGVDSPDTEKDLDVIDKHEVEEQGEESPKIEVNQEFGPAVIGSRCCGHPAYSHVYYSCSCYSFVYCNMAKLINK